MEVPRGLVDAFLERVPVTDMLSRATVTWERRHDGTRMAAFGEAVRLVGGRDEPLDVGADQARALARSIVSESPPAAAPRFFGGARFRPGGRVRAGAWDAFGGWQFLLPRVLLAFGPGGVQGSLVGRPSEVGSASRVRALVEAELARHPSPAEPAGFARADGAEPPGAAEWSDRVADAVSAIRAGRYAKVVLALQSVMRLPGPPDLGRLLDALAARYPACYAFRFAAGDASWLGASPELLVSVSGGVVRAASLAGSRPRGSTAEEDDRLAAELLADPKERDEHGLVVAALTDSLRGLCGDVRAPSTPQVMRVANIQHLHTPVSADLRPGIDILDLVSTVHPTPAVGGAPRSQALAAIDALEGIDRGWYAGPVGWMDLAGNGEFAVALRSALVRGTRVDLFAGCGIVAGSRPAAELAEAQHKLRALVPAIEAAQA